MTELKELENIVGSIENIEPYLMSVHLDWNQQIN